MSDRSSSLLKALGATLLAAGVATAPAHAGTISAAEVGFDKALLSNFNLVTLGDYNNSSNAYQYIGGRAIVGGNATATNSAVGTSTGTFVCNDATKCSGNATVAVDASQQTNGVTTQTYGTFTVFGNLVAGANSGFAPGRQGVGGVTGSVAGTTYVGGNASGYVYGGGVQNMNVRGTSATASGVNGLYYDTAARLTTRTGAAATGATMVGGTTATAGAASVFPFNSTKLFGEIKGLAAGIAALPGTPGVTAQTIPTGTTAFVTAADKYDAAGKRYGVITTTVAELAGKTGGLTINNNGLDATFVIVKGDCPSCMLPTLNSYAGQNKVIFDFVDATALKFSGVWNASILAPLATITAMGGAIDGSVIVASISQTQAILSNNLFAGDLMGLIPEPSSMALFGVGAAAAGLLRRRRARRAA